MLLIQQNKCEENLKTKQKAVVKIYLKENTKEIIWCLEIVCFLVKKHYEQIYQLKYS